MKHSIRQQIALIFMGVMMGTVLLCQVVNNMFLERYYIRSKTKVIYEAYESIRQAAGSDTYSSEKFRKELDDVCSVANITVLVIDANSQIRYPEDDLRRRRIPYHVRETEHGDLLYHENAGGKHSGERGYCKSLFCLCGTGRNAGGRNYHVACQI